MKNILSISLMVITILFLSSCTNDSEIVNNDYSDEKSTICNSSSHTLSTGYYLYVYDSINAKNNDTYSALFYAQDGSDVTYSVDCNGMLVNATWWIGTEVYQRGNYSDSPKYYKIN